MRNSLGVVVVALVFAAASSAFVYNISDDWSDVSNPMGAWSLCYNDTVVTNHFYAGGSQGYWGSWTSLDGSFSKAVKDGGPDWGAGDVAIHALSANYGGATVFTNVKWTSPADGFVNISGQAWDAYFYSNRQASWTVTLNGEILAQRSGVRDVSKADPASQFSNNLVSGKSLTGLVVNAGDVVQFTTKAETYYGHFVGLNMNVEFIPEPTAITTFCFGFLGFISRRRI